MMPAALLRAESEAGGGYLDGVDLPSSGSEEEFEEDEDEEGDEGPTPASARPDDESSSRSNGGAAAQSVCHDRSTSSSSSSSNDVPSADTLGRRPVLRTATSAKAASQGPQADRSRGHADALQERCVSSADGVTNVSSMVGRLDLTSPRASAGSKFT